jgi:ubiquinone biosynthesis protein UbiJ
MTPSERAEEIIDWIDWNCDVGNHDKQCLRESITEAISVAIREAIASRPVRIEDRVEALEARVEALERSADIEREVRAGDDW